eukprot:CAMPEP_0114592952 /NCGR_PEP_ID=MMETSP0125-20121206/14652_1 /TAXON_ID=485358 ORGANISM="Aristerostoma sp., Strain ATCC 50986" /NCGR_SAMPLE_ID=MMETSP0125 /ASSEMBLY_ACC=CAM_ASM_000245 /LENGTH=285 /DNA_ID=CAMNT_0001791857 /DNA_START=280 /DNA_END=1137 /DNA_ORIENTATION=-
MYNDLDIQCEYFDKCKKVVKLSDLADHEATCQLPKCFNYEICENHAKNEFGSKPHACSPDCLLLAQIREANGDYGKILTMTKAHLDKFCKPAIGNFGGGGFVSVGSGSGNSNISNIKWDRGHCGTGIQFSDNDQSCFLKEGPYMFRTVIADTPLNGGVHYWEIHADKRTDNELKIGIALQRDFTYNSAFCDHEFGYAFYGLGQLRHGSNASGTQYGKRFKKEGVLGCFLDQNRGILSFALNGEYFGPAFKNEALKKGPAYPAVSLLHCAGCKIVGGMPVPNYFLK